MTVDAIIAARDEEARKAWNSLGRYKFFMFGYHAAAWVKFNDLLEAPFHSNRNPFGALVRLAKDKTE